uniref:Glycosyltransferase RgtA/B/C/D-like domain-containing protein n=1 Tax=Solibacter usitatus (strain Ellin6076) TaxID=234267 RepID=Q02BL3_SOLUE
MAPSHAPEQVARRPRLQCLFYAILAAGLGLAWQTTLVHKLYNGNWSALFYHGVFGNSVPNDPAFAGTYLFPADFGFDGQYYRVVAHDPFRTRDYLPFIERPVMRYRRILIPMMAYAFAWGRQPNIDGGFFAAILIFLGLGVYWLGRYAALYGRTAKWGWAFLLAPATLAGLERGAIDMALTALTVGFALYVREQSRYRLLLVLILAGLCRETGLCLIAGCAAASVLEKNWERLAVSCASLVPTLAWYGFVHLRTPPDHSSNLMRIPLTDLVDSLLHHDVSYIKTGGPLVQAMYYAAVFGMLLAFAFTIRLVWKGWTSPEGLAALAFTMTGLLLQPAGLWVQPYHFGRVLAPVLVLLGLEYFRTGAWKKIVPLCIVSPAILLVSLATALRLVKHLRM